MHRKEGNRLHYIKEGTKHYDHHQQGTENSVMKAYREASISFLNIRHHLSVQGIRNQWATWACQGFHYELQPHMSFRSRGSPDYVSTEAFHDFLVQLHDNMYFGSMDSLHYVATEAFQSFHWKLQPHMYLRTRGSRDYVATEAFESFLV